MLSKLSSSLKLTEFKVITSRGIFLLLATWTASPSTLKATEIIFNDFLPQHPDNYWSYIGEAKSDTHSARLSFRRSVTGTSIIDNKRTQRLHQELISSTLEDNSELNVINQLSYTTSSNGWRIFAEQANDQILYFDRSALVLPSTLKVGSYQKYKTRLDPKYGRYGIISYFTSVVGFEDIDIPNGTTRAIKLNQEKRTKIAEDEKMESVTSQSSEFSSFWLAEGVGIVKQETMLTSMSKDLGSSLSYKVELAATNYLPNYLWPDATKTEDGWTHVEWFGYLTDTYFPWIFHEKHGWLFIDAEDESEIRLWSQNLGWWLTSSELYPTFFAVDINDWITFNTDSTVERQFIRSDGTILTASNHGFRFRPNTNLPPKGTIESPYEQTGFNEFEDSRGNRFTDSDSGLIQNPGSSPEVEVISPLDGTLIAEDQKLAILIDAFDQDGEILQVKIIVNGRTIDVVEKAPFYTYFTPDRSIETYTLYAIAIDNHQNQTRSSDVLFRINVADQKPPKVRVASPLNKTHFKLGEKVWVEVIASDEDGFVEEVALNVDGIQVGDEKKTPPYTFGFIPPILGSYSISAVAKDDDGNISDATSINIQVTATGIADSANLYSPEVRIISPNNRALFSLGETITIEAEAFDEDGSIERVQVLVDGIQVGSTLTSPPFRTTFTPQTPGTYQISAKARDNLRNETTSTAVSITVNP